MCLKRLQSGTFSSWNSFSHTLHQTKDSLQIRRVYFVGEIHHIHMIAVPLEMPSATDVVRWAILQLCALQSHWTAWKKMTPRLRPCRISQLSFLDMVEDPQNSRYWTASIFVNGSAISFKPDTGAEVTVITKQTLESLGSPNLTNLSENSVKLTVDPWQFRVVYQPTCAMGNNPAPIKSS